jgi:hypothetical protein
MGRPPTVGEGAVLELLFNLILRAEGEAGSNLKSE